jgi:hypothetical protein
VIDTATHILTSKMKISIPNIITVLCIYIYIYIYIYIFPFDWIDLAEDRDRWHSLVNVVMNLQVP